MMTTAALQLTALSWRCFIFNPQLTALGIAIDFQHRRGFLH